MSQKLWHKADEYQYYTKVYLVSWHAGQGKPLFLKMCTEGPVTTKTLAVYKGVWFFKAIS